MMEEALQITKETTNSSVNGTGSTGYYMEKKKKKPVIRSCFTRYRKIKSWWVFRLRCKRQNSKIVEENVGEYL